MNNFEFFSPTRDVLVTDELCEAVMRTVVGESAAVLANPRDYEARANVMWGVAPDGDVRRTAAEGIARYRAWLKSIGMPSTLAELGGRAEDILRLTCHRPQ